MKKQVSVPILFGLGVAAWLTASGLLTWFHFAFDGAFEFNPVFWWVFGGCMIFSGLFTDDYAENRRPKKMPRWSAALELLLLTAAAYLLIQQFGSLYQIIYWPFFWYLVLEGLILLVFRLYCACPFRPPLRPHKMRSSVHNAALSMLILFVPSIVSSLLYLAILHPVSVAQITPIGEAEGGKYINHISAKSASYPLGLYFFADIENERWYYYDVLTGQPIEYEDPFYPNLSFQETFS